jgi:hypothetical protein
MGRAKGIHDKYIADSRHTLGKFVFICFFTAEKAHVFQQGNRAQSQIRSLFEFCQERYWHCQQLC